VTSLPQDVAVLVTAAVVALPIAWLLVRDAEPDRPSWAVRAYQSLFRAARFLKQANATYPRREAFLATWFLCFFALFMAGVTLWGEWLPGSGHRIQAGKRQQRTTAFGVTLAVH
jgi:hypothetical protein